MCASLVEGTEPQIIEQYIRNGQAKLIYRHLLQLGDASRVLAEASECGGEQGRFWELRRLIYANQRTLYGASGYESVQPLVQQLGLDEGMFQQCLADGKYRAQVEADYAAAQSEGVFSRPVIDVNGKRIAGGQPFATFQAAIDAAR